MPPMQARAHPIATLLALTLTGLILGGCGTINEKLAAGAGDFIPQWAAACRRMPRRGAARRNTTNT